jgi:hypothetical protein
MNRGKGVNLGEAAGNGGPWRCSVNRIREEALGELEMAGERLRIGHYRT